jgi:lysine-specific demethylase 8
MVKLSDLLQVAGYRTVPIELGRRYTDDSWTQSLMTIGHFVDRHLTGGTAGRVVGYLAQHELFEQVNSNGLGPML